MINDKKWHILLEHSINTNTTALARVTYGSSGSVAFVVQIKRLSATLVLLTVSQRTRIEGFARSAQRSNIL